MKPCICGTDRKPITVRRGPKTVLWSLMCPACKRRTPISRIEQLDLVWDCMQDELQRLQKGTTP